MSQHDFSKTWESRFPECTSTTTYVPQNAPGPLSIPAVTAIDRDFCGSFLIFADGRQAGQLDVAGYQVRRAVALARMDERRGSLLGRHDRWGIGGGSPDTLEVTTKCTRLRLRMSRTSRVLLVQLVLSSFAHLVHHVHHVMIGGCHVVRSSLHFSFLQDKQGNILLVGQEASDELNTVDDETFTSYITEDNSDFACVKLSSSGEELWTWKDASKAGTDWMVAAGADSSDNVRIHKR